MDGELYGVVVGMTYMPLKMPSLVVAGADLGVFLSDMIAL